MPIARIPLPHRGFTVIELLITLTMLGILVALALPSFREAGLNTASTAQVNDLSTALNLARSEATKQARPVRVSALGGDWATGWEVATDADRDGASNGDDFQ
ncbi:MAG: GspH/FimT family pseudopilin [Xanthomonadales bacterium]|nr:GspH/FimT family pseudopilin [Xanthomonadales bacterium]